MSNLLAGMDGPKPPGTRSTGGHVQCRGSHGAGSLIRRRNAPSRCWRVPGPSIVRAHGVEPTRQVLKQMAHPPTGPLGSRQAAGPPCRPTPMTRAKTAVQSAAQTCELHLSDIPPERMSPIMLRFANSCCLLVVALPQRVTVPESR
jgi:hypothetical protein